LKKNTTIPTSKTQVFSTAADNQPSVEIHVLQGERPMAIDNKTLGRFILDGLPPAPRGVPQVEVSFDVDANGILNVKALDKATSKEQSIRIEASSGLSEEEIEKMKKDAEAHAGEDKKKQEWIEIKNTADTMVYTTEKMMKDVEEKKIEITPEERKAVEEKLKELKEIKDKEEKQEEIKTVAEELSKSCPSSWYEKCINLRLKLKKQAEFNLSLEIPQLVKIQRLKIIRVIKKMMQLRVK